jgi:ABC-type branched-subunit amino acid transport system ATPase component
VILVEGLRKSFGDVRAVERVDLRVERGERGSHSCSSGSS